MNRGRFVLFGSFVLLLFVAIFSPSVVRETSHPETYTPKTSDAYDPNDSFSDASSIGSGEYAGLTIGYLDNNDWYYVYVDSNHRLTVEIEWALSYYDLYLYLYDSDYDYIESSTSSGSGLEEVTYDVQMAGYYYVNVYFYSYDSTITYSLNVNNSVDIYMPQYAGLIAILIIVFVIAIAGVVVAVIKQNKKNASIRSRSYTPVRSPVQTPAPIIYYTSQPSTYETPIPPKPLVQSETNKPGSTPRFCISCGTQLEPAQRFCHNCGVDVEALR